MSTSEHPEQDDVQGHMRAWSDEQLKQAITTLERALVSLRGVGTASS
jgi:ribosomal protein L29